MSTLPIVNVGYDSTNYYVLGNHTNRLLIDVGWPGTLPRLLNMLKRKGIALQDIEYLLITHYHPVHAGLAQEIKQKGIQLIVDDNQMAAIPQLRRHMKPHHQYVDIDLQDAIQLSTTQSRNFLHSMGLNGEIISTPGHSDDSISLVLDEEIAFTGDLPPSRDRNEDPADAINQSWDRLRSLHVKTIYPGHGPVQAL